MTTASNRVCCRRTSSPAGKKMMHEIKEKPLTCSKCFKCLHVLHVWAELTFKVRLFPGQVSDNSLELSEFTMLGVDICLTVGPNIENDTSQYYQLKQWNSAVVKIHTHKIKTVIEPTKHMCIITKRNGHHLIFNLIFDYGICSNQKNKFDLCPTSFTLVEKNLPTQINLYKAVH